MTKKHTKLTGYIGYNKQDEGKWRKKGEYKTLEECKHECTKCKPQYTRNK